MAYSMKCPHCGKDVYAHHPKRNEDIVNAVLSGESQKDVAKAHGISYSTVLKIIRKSERAQIELDRRMRARMTPQEIEEYERYQKAYEARYGKKPR